MITQYNASNAKKYNQLFAKASVALGNAQSYTPVVVADASEYARSLTDGVVYYVDFVYSPTDKTVELGTDFLAEAFYIRDEEDQDKYVRAFTYIPETLYYELTCTPISGFNADTPDYDPEQTYYIASSAITTLEEYFCQLKNLLGISYKYIMLPLDEPPLEIDANKRTITIPANFKSSGLSVEGDQLAETIFFKVARFFDAMDLSTCEIAVQWILPNKEEYMTSIYMIDIESDPNSLIFACPLTSEITKVAGVIELAVRFYKMSGDNTISYSLNTLPVKASIGKALEISSNPSQVTESSVKDLFAAAIENSDMAAGAPAPAPVFMTALGSNYIDGSYETKTVYLHKTTDNTLTVEAEANPAGVISYAWFFTPTSGGIGRIIDANEDGKSLTLNTDGPSITGTYQVKAVNRINNKTARAWSNVIALPAPNELQLNDLTDCIVEDTAVGIELEVTEVEGTHQPEADYEYVWDVTSSTGESLVYNTKEINAIVPGYYKATVNITMNGDEKTAETNQIRVTELPQAVNFVGLFAEDAYPIEVNNNIDEYSIEIPAEYIDAPEVDNAFNSDGIEYHWYIDEDTTGVLDPETNEVIDKAVELTYDPSKPAISELKFPNNTNIRCVAVNTLNGAVKRSESVRIFVSVKPEK